MDYRSLICSFSFFGAAFAFYKIHKLWLKDQKEKKDLYDFEVSAGKFKHWMLIIMLIMAGIAYFFKGI